MAKKWLPDKMILTVALPVPLQTNFDYLPGKDMGQTPQVGMRVAVPFGRERRKMGVILDMAEKSDCPEEKLREALYLPDEEPVLDAASCRLCRWAADYYCCSSGEMTWLALPALLRRLSKKIPDPRLAQARKDWRARPLRADKHPLANQQKITGQILPPEKKYRPALLHAEREEELVPALAAAGRQIMEQGGQVLVLAPTIADTENLASQLEIQHGLPAAVLHSQLTPKRQLATWLAARDGRLSLLIGTRSAIFTPLPHLGLIAVHREHDVSFKREDGPRHSARDLAVVRARQANIPVVLSSTTPSAETLHNANEKRYFPIAINRKHKKPRRKVIDIRALEMDGNLSLLLLSEMKKVLGQGGNIFVLCNRRGYAPLWQCADCLHIVECPACAATLARHTGPDFLCCYYCGKKFEVSRHCPHCLGSHMKASGYGTQRVEEKLLTHFPGTRLHRADKDNKANGKKAKTGTRIFVGTQMLIGEKELPPFALTAVVDADSLLFAQDFRAGERAGQLLWQLAGKTHPQGQLWMQTTQPGHSLLKALSKDDYLPFAQNLLRRRQRLQLPPFSRLTLVRAEAQKPEAAERWLTELQNQLGGKKFSRLHINGPLPPVNRSQQRGRHRRLLSIYAAQKSDMNKLLPEIHRCARTLRPPAGLRWSLDVDPLWV